MRREGIAGAVQQRDNDAIGRKRRAARRSGGSSVQHKAQRGSARTSGTMKAAHAAMVQSTLSHWMLSLPCLNSATGETATARPEAGLRACSVGRATPRSATRPASAGAASVEAPARARTHARGAATAREPAPSRAEMCIKLAPRRATGAAMAASLPPARRPRAARSERDTEMRMEREDSGRGDSSIARARALLSVNSVRAQQCRPSRRQLRRPQMPHGLLPPSAPPLRLCTATPATVVRIPAASALTSCLVTR